MSYFLKLDQFEGPLDLLLHLIKVNEIDIFNIDIFKLAKEYLDFLRLVKFDDLQQAGEFLQMASTLIEMKSKQLLPNEEQELVDDELGDDPVRSLQDRLVELEKIKKAAEFLGSRPQVGQDIQTNQEWQRLLPEYDKIEAPLMGDSASLVILYEQMMKTLPERRVTKVEAKMHMISIEDKINELSEMLERINFALFQGLYKKFETRYELVVYTMAMLEMARWDKMKVYQNEILGPIWMYKVGFDAKELPLSHEEKSRLIGDTV